MVSRLFVLTQLNELIALTELKELRELIGHVRGFEFKR